MFKLLISVLIVMLGWYYLIVIAQLLGIFEVQGFSNEGKVDWKILIPFY